MKIAGRVEFILRNDPRSRLGLAWVVALLVTFASPHRAFSSNTCTDLIVRLSVQNHFQIDHWLHSKQSRKNLKKLNSLSVRVLNREEGLVQIRFADHEAAMSAAKTLVADGTASSAAPDFLYRPEVIYQLRDVSEKIAKSQAYLAPMASVEDFLGFKKIWSDLTGNAPGPSATPAPEDSPTTLPDVNPAPTDVQAGADPLESSDWAISQVQMPSVDVVNQAQAAASASTSPIIVAIIDTGIDYNHEDLSGAMWREPSDSSVVGYDFAHDNAKPYDILHFDIDGCLNDPNCSLGLDNSNQYLTNPGHGTHCAGHVGAVANNSTGIRGVGGNVQLMALKFFYDQDDPNPGQGDDAAAIQSIDYAIQKGAKIISASWGNREKRDDANQSELQQALVRAQSAGVLVVVAAGNNSIDQDSDPEPVFPAAYPLDNLLVVAASDSDDDLADFSNYGATSVQIAAPGTSIFSTTVGPALYNDVVASYLASNGQTYEIDWNGTSMAAPFVAGAAALIWSQHPDENYLQIKNRILTHARPSAGLQGKVSAGGVLDVSAALGPEASLSLAK